MDDNGDFQIQDELQNLLMLVVEQVLDFDSQVQLNIFHLGLDNQCLENQ